MTIVMEEEGFSTSFSSLSCLSPQSNFQTLTSENANFNSTQLNTSNTISSNSPNGNNNNSNSSSNIELNGPYAIFLFRSNSGLEMFEERKIPLDKPCKIGRSVAKIKPESNNAIFDCKVLSRNHALLWHENGKFFLQDTKSSNGTFLNGNRLGKSNEDSLPFELTSSDIIQFGVDVTENTKKVTHGCITVEIKLFHKPGVEANNKSNQNNQSNKLDIQTQELYQLALFLQEAMMREEILHQKLNSLQNFIDQAKETSENGWLTLIDEDRLLSRIDFLEKQSLVYTKNVNEENMKKCINSVRNEKFNVENTAKLTVQKMIEEKNLSAQKYDELKIVSSIKEEECKKLEKLLEESKSNLLDLAGKYQELLNEVAELQKEQEETKQINAEKLAQVECEKLKYESKLEESLQNEKTLNAKIESLIVEKDFANKRLEGIISKLKKNELFEINDMKESQEKRNIIELIKSSCLDNDNLNNHNEQIGEESLKEERLYFNEDCFQQKQSEISNDLENTNAKYNQDISNIVNKESIEIAIEEHSEAKSTINPCDNNNFADSNTNLNSNETKRISNLSEIPDLLNCNDEIYKSNNRLKNSFKNNAFNEKFILIKNLISQLEIDSIKIKNILQSKEDPNKLLAEYSEYLSNNSRIINDLKEAIEIENEHLNELPIESIKKPENEANSKTDLEKQDQENNNDQNEKELLKNQEIENYKNEINYFKNMFDELNNEYDMLSLKTKIVSYVSTFPLILLIIAIMIAFYPYLAAITATGL